MNDNFINRYTFICAFLDNNVYSPSLYTICARAHMHKFEYRWMHGWMEGWIDSCHGMEPMNRPEDSKADWAKAGCA